MRSRARAPTLKAMNKSQTVTPELIEKLVYRFYDQVRADPLLGPVFDKEIGDGWDHHLPKMVAFWSSVILKTRSYNGRPVPAHAKLEGLTKAHFERWLTLFEKTAHDLFVAEKAQMFIYRAHQIANSLKMAIDVKNGMLPGMPGALAG